ncbi:MAG: cation:proton antiporter [Spirochaetia bacterium]|jgi:Kef-type K+ transport system membrane component KefB|nr:cation:proton antiporter [Spirochaetia bacterium]
MSERMMVLVLQLGVILIVSKFVGYVFSRYLRQPKVLGELVAGMLIGPYLLGSIPLGSFGPLFPLITDSTIPVSAELYAISTLGSIFLLFDSGLETDLPTFLRFSGKATVVGFGGVILSFLLGDGITYLLCSDVHSVLAPEAMFLGTVCTATSIGITARILGETKKIGTPEGVTIMAAAVLDDVISIVLLSVVVGVASVEMNGGAIQWSVIGSVAVRAIAFWLACMVAGIIIAPFYTKGMKRFHSLPLISEISFGIALLLAGFSEMAGLAMIIGAYITGLALSQTDVAHSISTRMQSVGEFFVPVFFAVMGMMVNFDALKSVFGFALIFSLIAFLGKLLGCGLPSLLVGFNLRGALRIGTGMLPRGEVTLIVAGIGLASGAIAHDMFGVAVMTMLVASIAAPPLLIEAFKGGESGYRKSLQRPEQKDRVSIELEFPTTRIAEFFTESLIASFIQEGFFTSSIESVDPTWQIRKENTVLLLKLLKGKEDSCMVSIGCGAEDQDFVRLMMVDAMADFSDFAQTVSSMKNEEMMSAKLLMQMFDEA